MKTTIDINDKLLEDVRKLLKTTTIKATVNSSLLFVRRQLELQARADTLGTIELDLTQESLRRQRGKRTGRVPR
jgi:hypothetical protein